MWNERRPPTRSGGSSHRRGRFAPRIECSPWNSDRAIPAYRRRVGQVPAACGASAGVIAWQRHLTRPLGPDPARPGPDPPRPGRRRPLEPTLRTERCAGAPACTRICSPLPKLKTRQSHPRDSEVRRSCLARCAGPPPTVARPSPESRRPERLAHAIRAPLDSRRRGKRPWRGRPGRWPSGAVIGKGP